ncbi:MAG: MurR/RpiR family transcriptional regulator [Intestinibacter sp.]|uniref:MurR/RpiR family transcriptional regulator n=1 Tax=Intestinibacter sp. TaxID=1965304 RepID=UPI003F16F20B
MGMSLDKLVYKHYKNLNENDKYIWGYILNNKKKCQNMSIQELSASCNVSHTTILRFAQKLGLNGYSELKFYLKLENSEQVNQEKVDLRNLVDDTNKTMNILMEFDYSKIFNLLDNCNKIYAYGSGEVQKNAVKDLKRNLLVAGKLVNVIEGREEISIMPQYITKNDVVFLYSLSGENKRVNNFAEILRTIGTKIISISQVGNNTLSKLSDVNIQFYTRVLMNLKEDLPICPVSQFFMVNEFLILKYLEYKNVKK